MFSNRDQSPSILKSASKLPKMGLRKTVTFEDEIQPKKLQFDVRELENIDHNNSDTFDELVTNLNNLNIVSQTEMCSKGSFFFFFFLTNILRAF